MESDFYLLWSSFLWLDFHTHWWGRTLRSCRMAVYFLAAVLWRCRPPTGPESYLPAQDGYSVYPTASYVAVGHLCLGNCWLISWVAADWAPLTLMSGWPWLHWEREHWVHWHILPVGYLVPNPEIFCDSVKTIRVFTKMQSYQHFQWTNMDIHLRQFLLSLMLKTPATLQSKRTKPPGVIKWTMMEWWKNSFNYRFSNSSEREKPLFEIFRNLWLRAERVGWVGWEGAVSQSHSSSDSRDKTACGGSEKSLITTEVNNPIHLSCPSFYRFLHAGQSHISVWIRTFFFLFHSRAIIKLGPLIHWNLCVPTNDESSIHPYPKGNFPS